MLFLPNRVAEFREAFAQKRWVTDGAMATMLYSKGASRHRPVEELNLTLAALVRDVHREYLAAGAEILRTNTFSSNRIRLARWDLEAKLAPINRAAVRIARESAKDQAYIAGVIGPTGLHLEPIGRLSLEDARSVFRQQALALAGVDLFILETFGTLGELRAAIEGVREAAGEEVVIVAEVSVDELGRLADGSLPGDYAQSLMLLPADAVGMNCSAGPYSVYEAIRVLQTLSPLYPDRKLAASPSAGVGKVCSPDYFLRQFPHVHVAGGCCGTTPEHIRALRDAVEAWPSGGTESNPDAFSGVFFADTQELPRFDQLGHKLAAGQFITLAEAGRNGNWDVASVSDLSPHSPDAIGILSTGEPHPLVIARNLQEQGLEALLYVPSRGRTALQLQNELFAAHRIGVRNILCVTSDRPGYPDIDSIGLVRIAAGLNRGIGVSGHPAGVPTQFTIGVGFDPYEENLDLEIERFRSKVEAGAQFAITHPIFDVTVFEDLLRRIEDFKIPLIAAARVIGDARAAHYTVNEVGIPIPQSVLARIEAGEGLAVARELAEALRPLAQGIHVTFS